MDKTQEKAIEIAIAGHNVLICGPPGCGKSYTVCALVSELKKRKKVSINPATSFIDIISKIIECKI